MNIFNQQENKILLKLSITSSDLEDAINKLTEKAVSILGPEYIVLVNETFVEEVEDKLLFTLTFEARPKNDDSNIITERLMENPPFKSTHKMPEQLNGLGLEEIFNYRTLRDQDG